MHWVVQEDLYRESGMVQLIDLLDRSGIPYSLHKVIPFIGELHPDIDVDGPVMCMGSYSLRHVAKRKGWAPGVFDLADFTYPEQVKAWPGQMLNEDLVECQFKDVPALMPSDEVFIRPVADSKFFAGSILTRAELEPWVKSVVELEEDYGDSLSASTVVLMSEPRNILLEVRCWIVNRRLVTASVYKRGNRVLYSSEVDAYILEYAQDMASRFSPLDAYVMDVCVLEDKSLRIVECNTFNAAGLYAGDVGKIVEAIERLETERVY